MVRELWVCLWWLYFWHDYYYYYYYCIIQCITRNLDFEFSFQGPSSSSSSYSVFLSTFHFSSSPYPPPSLPLPSRRRSASPSSHWCGCGCPQSGPGVVICTGHWVGSQYVLPLGSIKFIITVALLLLYSTSTTSPPPLPITSCICVCELHPQMNLFGRMRVKLVTHPKQLHFYLRHPHSLPSIHLAWHLFSSSLFMVTQLTGLRRRMMNRETEGAGRWSRRYRCRRNERLCNYKWQFDGHE